MRFARVAEVAVEEEYPTTPFPCGAEVHGERLGHCSGPADGFDGCCRTFYGLEAWNKPRTGPHSDRRCRTDAELADKGLTFVDGIWRMAQDDIDADPAALESTE